MQTVFYLILAHINIIEKQSENSADFRQKILKCRLASVSTKLELLHGHNQLFFKSIGEVDSQNFPHSKIFHSKNSQLASYMV